MEINFNFSKISYFIDLLKITETKADAKNFDYISNLDFKSALSEIVEITQNKWLRPAGLERWDLENNLALIEHKNEIIKLLANLGFINSVQPCHKQYESVLLLGASDINIIRRINYLKNLWDLGVRFNQCYLLTGGFKIRHDLSDINNSNNIHLKRVPNTDTDLILEVYKQLSYHWPHPLNQLEVIPIVAKNSPARPDTRATLNAWLKLETNTSTILAISNQPFIPYQSLVIQSVLKDKYHSEVVGMNADTKMNIKIMLDSVARFLYEYSYRLNFIN